MTLHPECFTVDPGRILHVPDERAAIVAETLRFLAGGWISGDEDHENSTALVETAANIEHAAKWPWSESGCCPLCEEVACDTGCPLAPLRRGVTEG